MAVRVEPLVFLASVVFHAGLGYAVVRVEPRELPPPPPVVITVRDVEPEPPKPKPPEPEPEPEPEQAEPEPAEPEVETPEPVEPEPPPPSKPRSAPEPAPAEPAPAQPSAPPEFGLELGGGGSGPGLDVPEGDPNGKPGGGGGGTPKKKVAAQTRKLSAPEPAKTKSGCNEDASKPKPLKLDKPTYTEAARAAAIEGAVRLKISVAADGSVTDVDVLQSLDPELDARAVAAAKAASFEPARRCGEAVAASLTVSIRFSL